MRCPRSSYGQSRGSVPAEIPTLLTQFCAKGLSPAFAFFSPSLPFLLQACFWARQSFVSPSFRFGVEFAIIR